MARLPGGALVALVLLAGCSTAPAPPASEAATTPSTATDTPAATTAEPATSPPVAQAETDWGPIWTAVPAGFPGPPGGQPADDGDGPASAAWTVAGSDASATRSIADGYVEAFSTAGYGGGVDGPLEDGSWTAWASNGYGCDILVTVRPRGSAENLVTVLFGAGCPFRWSTG